MIEVTIGSVDGISSCRCQVDTAPAALDFLAKNDHEGSSVDVQFHLDFGVDEGYALLKWLAENNR